MDFVMKAFWFVVRTLLIAFAFLAIEHVIWPNKVPLLLPLAVILLVLGLIVLAGIADSCHQVWFLYRERLQAICIGVSLKPFDWRLGDVTGAGYPGRWWALGPLRIGAKTRPQVVTLDDIYELVAQGVREGRPYEWLSDVIAQRIRLRYLP